MNGEGWSVRVDVDGRQWLDGHDGKGWFRWEQPSPRDSEGAPHRIYGFPTWAPSMKKEQA